LSGLELAIVEQSLGAVVSKAAKIFFTSVRRSFAIAKARHGAEMPKTAAGVLAAIRLEFGREGELTVGVDRFLRLLASEQLFEAILADAFYRTQNDDVKAAFVAFFSRSFPDADEEQATRLYVQLQVIAAAYIEFELGETPLSFLLRASLGELTAIRSEKRERQTSRQILEVYDSERERALAHAGAYRPLVSIDHLNDEEDFTTALRRLKPWFFVPEIDIAEVHARLAAAVLADTEALEVFGPQRRISTPFDGIYVKPELEPLENSREATTFAPPSWNYPSGREPDLIAPEKLFDFSHACVILGHPGTGKTSMSRYVERTALKATGQPLAVTIELRKYIAEKKQKAQHSLTQHALDKVLSLLPDLNPAVVRDVFLFSSCAGDMLFVYDGLDEILNVGERAAVSREVTRMAADYPRARHLLTSREVGYEQTAIRGWRHYRIHPFDRSRIEAYVANAARLVVTVPEREHPEFISKFMDQAAKAAEIAQIPLLLALMVVLFKERGHSLPDQRHQIYEQCAELFFIQRDATRDLLTDLKEPFRLTQLLNELASQIYGNRVLQAGVSRRWLEDASTEFFTKVFGGDRARARDAGVQFATYTTNRAWVFTMTGVDSYEFTHRTFLEYYYSEYISETKETLSDLFSYFRPKIEAGQETVVAHLCLQRYVKDGLSRSNKVIAALEETLDGTKVGSAAEARVCEFASEAIDYLAPGEAELQSIVETLTMRASDTTAWRSALYRVLRRAHRGQGVFEGVSAGLAKATRRGASKGVGAVYDYLYAVQLRRRGLIGGSAPLPDIIVDLSRAVEQSEPRHLAASFMNSPASIKLQWDCYQLDVALDAHVFQAWTSSVQLLARGDWLGVDMGALLRAAVVGELTDRERRLLRAVGARVSDHGDLVRLGAQRTVYVSPVTGLHRDAIKALLKNADADDVPGLVAALCIVHDYQMAATRLGRRGLIEDCSPQQLEELVGRGIQRVTEVSAALAERFAAFLAVSPKVISTGDIGRVVSAESLVAERTLFPWLNEDPFAAVRL